MWLQNAENISPSNHPEMWFWAFWHNLYKKKKPHIFLGMLGAPPSGRSGILLAGNSLFTPRLNLLMSNAAEDSWLLTAVCGWGTCR